MAIIQENIIPEMRNQEFLDIYSLNEKTDIDRLKEKYIFQHPDRVNKFLYQHPSLINLLFEAYTYIEKHFGENTPVKLIVSKDPEIEGDYEELFASIKTDLPAKEAVTRLSQLDHDWYLKQPSAIRRIFNFSI
jgi:hypothetical protein